MLHKVIVRFLGKIKSQTVALLFRDNKVVFYFWDNFIFPPAASYTLFVYLFISDKQQTAEPNKSKIFEETHVTPEKVYDLSKLIKFSSEKKSEFIILKIHQLKKKIGENLRTLYYYLKVKMNGIL